jgi:hypothetical protein
MTEITARKLADYRADTYRSKPGQRVRTKEEAVDYVNQRGFVYFWPIKGVEMPSLWAAVAGNRAVADAHDDPGHITWDWKDSLLGKKRWYYARLLRRRNTIISLEKIPYFYALSPNYGDYENDYLEQYELGQMTQEARLVYEALLKEGPLHTLALRKAARLSSETNSTRFNRALDDLQIQLKVLPVGVANAGAWHYAFIYDIVPRYMPEIEQQARPISEPEARKVLALEYLKSVGAAPTKGPERLFGWRLEDARRTVECLVEEGKLVSGVKVEGEKGEWLCLPELA